MCTNFLNTCCMPLPHSQLSIVSSSCHTYASSNQAKHSQSHRYHPVPLGTKTPLYSSWSIWIQFPVPHGEFFGVHFPGRLKVTNFEGPILETSTSNIYRYSQRYRICAFSSCWFFTKPLVEPTHLKKICAFVKLDHETPKKSG